MQHTYVDVDGSVTCFEVAITHQTICSSHEQFLTEKCKEVVKHRFYLSYCVV